MVVWGVWMGVWWNWNMFEYGGSMIMVSSISIQLEGQWIHGLTALGDGFDTRFSDDMAGYICTWIMPWRWKFYGGSWKKI